MAKLLTRKEAVEIIDTMMAEYGLEKAYLTFETEYGHRYWTLYQTELGAFKFFRWVINFKYKSSDPWERAVNLEDLVTAVENNMTRLDSRVDKAQRIRERHATRLLDQKLEE